MRLSVCLFARTTHLFVCSALHARSAAPTHPLTSGRVNDKKAIFAVFFFCSGPKCPPLCPSHPTRSPSTTPSLCPSRLVGGIFWIYFALESSLQTLILSPQGRDLLPLYTMVENGQKHRQNGYLIIHFPTSEGVSEVSERGNE